MWFTWAAMHELRKGGLESIETTSLVGTLNSLVTSHAHARVAEAMRAQRVEALLLTLVVFVGTLSSTIDAQSSKVCHPSSAQD